MDTPLTLHEDQSGQVQPVKGELPELIERGFREWGATGEPGFAALNAVLERLATHPNPQEVLDLRPSPWLHERIGFLLTKNKGAGLSPEEKKEWERYSYIEHAIRMAKLRTALKLKSS